ncbi:MAG: hypothetical protein GPJ51_11260 [Candidatus Heimdallarchaeota archaeon]|nr:hypothetical protein [Candidatus Heimdallarchaeota archaeon]
MEPKARRTYILTSSISIVLLGALIAIYFLLDFPNKVWIIVALAIVLLLVNVILFIWFARVREKEREDLRGNEFQSYKP